jgi:uncharacterized membrane protein YjfL (UPF0719 family)
MNEMKEYLLETLTGLPVGAGFVVLGLIVLMLAKIAKDFMTPYKLDQELTARDNPALGLSVTGYYLGVIIVFLGVLHDSGEDTIAYSADDFSGDLLEVFLYGLAGVVLLNLSRLIVDKFILSRFSTRKEIIEDRNVGTGAVEFGNYVTSGLIIAGAFHGEGDPFTAVVFFFLGQGGLILFSWLYQLFTRYDIHGEIERDNAAAGVALAGNMVAIGIVLLNALKGDFLGWAENITAFVVYAVAGYILLFAVRWVADLFMLPGATFDEEIARDRNINAAWIESAVVIGAASIILFSL